MVFELLVPEDAATVDQGYARNCVGIHDVALLEKTTGRPLDYFTASVPSFHHDNTWWLSAEAALLVAETACRTSPAAVLEWVTEDERQARDASKNGKQRTDLQGNRYTSDPGWEYRYYCEHDRPVHELVRQWCGHRAVSFHERLTAAEAEIQRLDELLAGAARTLRTHGLGAQADRLGDEHERERVTPFTIRVTVERPMDPNEIPVRTVYRRAWWR
ncbi:hypothetical protein [Cellulomonas endometrii]|uniref:hypothetical protein n=1 Tax=Cellulomonas endometrii TaxID=3036301 RepID=UPI0024AE2743|nr:hypothetical protein [Cellulomonas endometrii]